MTRLTGDNVKDISDTLGELERFLLDKTGWTIRKMACEAVGIKESMVKTEDYDVAVVPITSGLGVITKFSESVRDICKWLGFNAYVTDTTDVTGFTEAIARKADIVFMADDYEFIGYNTRVNGYSNNSLSTAEGYVACLDGASGSVKGKEVLVVGAGRVGSRAARLLLAKGAKVSITDVDYEKALSVGKENPALTVIKDVEEALRTHRYLLNASPAHIDSKNLMDGAVISSPGVPHTFDDAAYAKAKAIIHDPLVIGVATMAMESAALSVKQ